MEIAGKVMLFLVALVFLAIDTSSPTRYSAKRLQRRERKVRRKSNSIDYESRFNRNFQSDSDIVHYLKIYGEDSMIWRCKNAVQPYFDGHPLPLLELNCETLGVFKAVDWFHNGEKLPESDAHYKQTIVPHYARGRYFSRWLDFKLKIYNATTKDSGIYTFTAHSQQGIKLQHQIYVDISKKKKAKSNYLRSRKLRRRDYLRYYAFHNRYREEGYQRFPRKRMIQTGKNSYYMV